MIFSDLAKFGFCLASRRASAPISPLSHRDADLIRISQNFTFRQQFFPIFFRSRVFGSEIFFRRKMCFDYGVPLRVSKPHSSVAGPPSVFTATLPCTRLRFLRKFQYYPFWSRLSSFTTKCVFTTTVVLRPEFRKSVVSEGAKFTTHPSRANE